MSRGSILNALQQKLAEGLLYCQFNVNFVLTNKGFRT